MTKRLLKTVIYLHSNKEEMLKMGVALGLTGVALEMFKFACCEVAVELSVDPNTGEATIISIDKRKVESA